ncbi:PEGA domain-containing protein [Thermococcus sp. JCM 11816]
MTSPEGARVYVDGSFIGTTPDHRLQTTEGGGS